MSIKFLPFTEKFKVEAKSLLYENLAFSDPLLNGLKIQNNDFEKIIDENISKGKNPFF
jgi:hypothetical protein